MGGLVSRLRPGRSGGVDTDDGAAPGPSGTAPPGGDEPAPSAWKERRRRRRERRRDANELASQSHVKGDTKHWAKTAARHAREAVRTELRTRMRSPWGGEDAATTAGDAHEDEGASSNGGIVDDKHLRVVLDLGMQDLMCDAEIKSTVTQLQCSYASVLNLAVDAVIARNANRRDTDTPPKSDMLCTALQRKRRAARRMIEAAGPECEPPRLLFASLHGRIETALARDDGSARWPVTTSPQPFADAAKMASIDTNPIRNIVVMSPDAPIALTEAPSPRDVYVIGGLCDYKRIANATLDRAEAFKVTARRLPIEETLGTNLNVNILTVNQTAECLFRARLNDGDWAAALQDVLPKRKLEEVEETRRKREAARS